jgi:hypothetical protein
MGAGEFEVFERRVRGSESKVLVVVYPNDNELLLVYCDRLTGGVVANASNRFGHPERILADHQIPTH